MKKTIATTIAAMAVMACNPAPTPVRVDVNRITDFTGRGNDDEPLLEIRVRPESGTVLDGMTVRLRGSSEISRITLSLDGKILGRKAVSASDSTVVFRFRRRIPGTATMVLGADIKHDAEEGGIVMADVISLDAAGKTIRPIPPLPGGREILLCRKLLYGPGDYGSVGWRIPAIRQLSDGTLLAVNDRRNDNEEDLPGCIDIAFKYSTDGGRTWTGPGYIARNGGYLGGYGDPGLGELPDGTVVCAFAGGEDFIHSGTEAPQHSFVSYSHDHGRSWTRPEDITARIWGHDATGSGCRDARSSFFTSGNYLVLKHGEHKGRLLIANVCHYPGDEGLSNHAVYTDDGGRNWHVSDIAVRGHGDEAKMVELPDGEILMSVRTTGDRIWVRSRDGGQTWPESGTWPQIHTMACNGDLIAYDDSILLHSIPISMHREDVGILLSFDGGRTWPESKLISPGPGQYSSLTVLPDGTIGAYIAKNVVGCEMWYQNFSLGWLRSRKEAGKQEMEGVRLWEGGPLWAERNLGAEREENPGGYFSWGETESKQVFGWERYAGTSYDASTAVLGEGWRTPSEKDFEELKERCEWVWTEKEGYPGYEVRGSLGTIFLPAGGYVSGNRHRHAGGIGQYWTSDTRTPATAREFWFTSEHTGACFDRGRDNGMPVRAIRDN